VVFGHLLEMRHRPLARRRISEESALDVIVHPTVRHTQHRMREHIVSALIPACAVLLQQEIQHLDHRKLRRISKSAVLRIVHLLNPSKDTIDRVFAQIACR
jgi:hypothetical protein